MAPAVGPGRAVDALVARCHAGLDAATLQREVVQRLGRLLSADAVFCASVDPATLLFTGALSHEIPADATPRFLANEFFEDDVNKFRALAERRVPVDWLDHATGSRRAASTRYREIMAPLGLGDELRSLFRSGGECWGVVCLHREDAPSGFSEADARVLARVSAHVGEGLRRSLLLEAAEAALEAPDAPDTPGVLLLDDAHALVATTAAGDRWLWELTHPDDPGPLPLAIEAVLVSLRALRAGRSDGVPQVRVRTRSGTWAVVHASAMEGLGTAAQVAVVVERAKRSELAPLILLAYGLTPREAEVAQLALQGKANKAVARELRISEHTVEDHLKSIFAKVGVGSRGELTARIFTEHYLP
ncbi:MAG: LuxR C-terminal-related transcriptional regulator [Acidimicrobiales bacterium]|nr:LuxR C-terminal-related transcriptional regulator [Acidimicrobiales bacterium]